MLFPRKLNRAMHWSRRKRMETDGMELPQEDTLECPQDLPTDEELRAEGKEVTLEKGDLPAMIFSALFTIVPVALVVLLILGLFAFALAGGF